MENHVDESNAKKKHFKKGTTTSRKTAIAIFKGYMRKNKRNEPLVQTEDEKAIYDEIVDKKLHLDSDFLADNFKYHADIFDDLEMSKEDFIEDFIDTYPDLRDEMDDVFRDEDYVDDSVIDEEVSAIIDLSLIHI